MADFFAIKGKVPKVPLFKRVEGKESGLRY
jgi:hypothetical protein